MIDVSGVYKTFYSRHKVEALVDVSLFVEKGEVEGHELDRGEGFAVPGRPARIGASMLPAHRRST